MSVGIWPIEIRDSIQADIVGDDVVMTRTMVPLFADDQLSFSIPEEERQWHIDHYLAMQELNAIAPGWK